SLHHLHGYRARPVLILSGDQLFLMDYRQLYRHHLETKADITVAPVPVMAGEAPACGILKTDNDVLITEFHEKPPLDDLDGKSSPVSREMEAAGRIYLASMGIYVFNRQRLTELLQRNPDHHDFGKQVIPNVIGELRVASYPFTGYW